MPTRAKPKRPARKAPGAKPSRVLRFPPSPKEAIALFDSVLEAVPGIERKTLFGYPCGFVNGYMTVGLHADDFFVRLPPEEQTPLLKLKGGRHLEVMPGRPMTEYVILPASLRVKKGGSRNGSREQSTSPAGCLLRPRRRSGRGRLSRAPAAIARSVDSLGPGAQAGAR